MTTNKEKGDNYEAFVLKVYEAINKFGSLEGSHKTIKLCPKHKLEDRDGNSREIDIYWEYQLLGETIRAGIECKDYNTRISVEKIEAYSTKLRSLGLNKGIFVTKIGYQKSAQDTANRNGISLMVIRDVLDDDLKDRIRKITVKIRADLAATITGMKVYPDIDWLEANTPYKEGDRFKISGLNSQIIIEDIEREERYSLWDLENNEFRDSELGEHEWNKHYQNAFLITDDSRYKLDGIKIKYYKPKDLTSGFEISDAGYYLAVLEYISQDNRKKLLKIDGSLMELS